MEMKWIFKAASSFNKLWHTKSIIKTNLDLGIICLKKIKNWAYLISLDEYADVGTHWIALFFMKSEIVYFNNFGVEHVPEEIKEFIRNKNIKSNIFRIQSNNSIMCGCFCTGFIDFILPAKL